MNRKHRCLALCLVALLGGWVACNPAEAAEETPSVARARTSPEWLRSSVVYQIYPRNFSAEGDFNAITAQLDALDDLGVNILWLMPIHPIGEKNKKGTVGSPYAVRDFYAVNPDYGTTNDLKRLIQGAHARGIRVVLDIVTGHTSWDNALIVEHPEFYKKDENGQLVVPNPGWTDVVALDYANPNLRRYIIDMMKYWLREFDVDGFRCDVAFAAPIDFWETVRTELMEVNPDLILFADANVMPQLLVQAFDMDNSWPLLYALNRVMSGVAPATLLSQSWANTRKQFPKEALHMRFSDGQPEPRAVARYGVHGALAAQVLMLTLDGVPLLYNGMEVGDATESADPALFEKMPVFWLPAGRPPLREAYSDVIRIRKENPAFWNDVVVWLPNSADEKVVSFMRKDEQNAFIVLINLSSHPVSGSVELPDAEPYAQLSIQGMPMPAPELLPDFRLGGYEWRIYGNAPKSEANPSEQPASSADRGE